MRVLALIVFLGVRVADAATPILLFAPEVEVSACQASLETKPGVAVFLKTSLAESPPSAQSWIGNHVRVCEWREETPADRVRLSLRHEGLYRVSAQELAEAGGWDEAAVSQALSETNLSLTCQGAPVAWMAERDNLYFYGMPAAHRYAPENVYWVAWGAGTNRTCVMRAEPEHPVTNAWFGERLTFQGTSYLSRVSYSSLADVPVSYLADGTVLLQNKAHTPSFTLPDCSSGVWNGAVTVSLVSFFEAGYEGHDHVARVSVGGVPVGDPAIWLDEQAVSLAVPFSSTQMVGEAVSLLIANETVIPAGAPDISRFLCLSYAFDYRRLYRARGDTLRCRGGDGNTVAVSGFGTNDVVVWDVTNPHQPVEVAPVAFAEDGLTSEWTASFSCGGSGVVYRVCSLSRGTREPSVRGVRDRDWASVAQAADYVMLIPPEGWCRGFRETLQPLADYRNAEGLKTVIVDVESLYDHYSDGLVDPLAIRAFCAQGRAWAGRPLRYLLLTGAGSLDFKHDRFTVGDYTACLIPTLIAGQRFSSGEAMTMALDGALGDVDGDDIPDVAIGRLPTTRTQDVATVVQKTIAYEGVLTREDGSLAKSYAVIAPDWNGVPNSDKYYLFDQATDRLRMPLEAAGRRFLASYPDPADPENPSLVKRDVLFPALQAGTGLFHFFGHSNKNSLGFKEPKLLLGSTDIKPTNWQRPTLAVLIGCQVNVWHYLTDYSVTLVPYGTFAKNTGFVAGLGSTGFFLAHEGAELGVHFYAEAAAQGTVRIGDALRMGLKKTMEDPVLDPEQLPSLEKEHFRKRILSFSLVGDPALVYRHDVTPQGTDVGWLMGQGQCAPQADLQDPDADGWPSWQEYQAGTAATGCVLRIKAWESMDEGRRALAFEANGAKRYHVEQKQSLAAGDTWQAVPWSWTNATDWTSDTVPIQPQGPVTRITIPGSPGASRAFFRIRELE